jgi:sec-independent protein translocase protein TatB
MLDIGWTEMLVIAVVMIVVVGPKDLPGMLRTFGRTTAKLRVMAGDFRKQFDEALKEAELDEVKKSVDGLRSLNPTTEIRKQLNPFEKAAADVRAGLETAMKPKPSTAAQAASPVAQPAEPLKNGAVASSTLAEPAAGAESPAAAPSAESAAAVEPAPPTADPQPAADPAASHPAPRTLQ